MAFAHAISPFAALSAKMKKPVDVVSDSRGKKTSAFVTAFQAFS
jgi:hypothetical protein